LTNKNDKIINRYKEKLNSLTKKVDSLKSKNQYLNKVIDKELKIKENLQNKLDLAIQETQFKDSEYLKLIDKNTILADNYKEIFNKYNILKNRVEEYESYNYWEQLQKSIEEITDQNNMLRKSISGRDRSITKLSKELSKIKLDMYIEKYKDEIQKLKHSQKSLSVENKLLKEKLEQYEPSQKYTEKNINTKDLFSNNDVTTRMVKAVPVEINTSCGFLKRFEDKFKFIDCDNLSHENVDYDSFYLDDVENIYCRVVYNKQSDIYKVKSVYPLIKSKEELISYLNNKDLKKVRMNKIKKAKSVEIVESYKYDYKFNGEKVLIVNSDRNNYYVYNLRKYNLKVDGFDSYSENPTILVDILPRYDIVIIITGASRHYVNTMIENAKDYIKDELFNSVNKKYQFMENVTLSKLLARINYTIENIK
jgi:predicted RNase H-like nuclease (RuvC/YqgF family)